MWTRIVNATVALCGSIGGDGFRHVHDALLSFTGLRRNTAPTTPGDYLKGIAVCARYVNGQSSYISGNDSLWSIAYNLENPKKEEPEPQPASWTVYIDLGVLDFRNSDGATAESVYFEIYSESGTWLAQKEYSTMPYGILLSSLYEELGIAAPTQDTYHVLKAQITETNGSVAYAEGNIYPSEFNW